MEAPRLDGPIHVRTAGFWSRLHDVGRPVLLKDVADNLKNYGLAAASYAGGVKLLEKATGFTAFSGLVLAVLAALFFIATLAQSWVLAQKQSQEIVPFTTGDRIRNGIKPAAKLWLYALIPVSLGSVVISAAVWFTKNAA